MSFSSKNISPARSTLPSTAAGDRVYAIGDVHGCHAELEKLLVLMAQHSQTLPPANGIYIVMLGDLIDRGPASARVMNTAMRIQQHNANFKVLMGNHEDMMLRSLSGDSRAFQHWLRLGGDATLASFGISAPPPNFTAWNDYIRYVIENIPPAYVEWLHSLPTSARSGDYFFCHAGVRPYVPLKRQSAADLMWIREAFLQSDVDHGAVIVHGHNVQSDAQVRDNRIGIDTGAFQSGVLTAILLEGTARTLLKITPNGPTVSQLPENHYWANFGVPIFA